MSKIEQLIKKLCPKGVEWRPLGEVCKRHHGTAITAGKMAALNKEGAPIRVFAAGNTIADVNEGDIPEKDVIREPGIVVKARGYIGFAYCERPFSHKGELWSYTAKGLPVNLKYLYYYLLTQAKQLHILARSKSVKLPQLSTGDTDNLFVPLPPRPVQDEIVKALDAMDAVVKSLEEERAARQEQFEALRERMINFDESVERRQLAEVFDLRNGYTPSKANSSFWDGGTIPWFRMEDIRENGRILSDAILHVTDRSIKGELFSADSLIVSTSATIGEHAWITVPALANQRFTNLTISTEYKSRLLMPFVFYLGFAIDDYCRKNTCKGNFASVDMGKFKQFPIPLPSLSVQKKIAAQLDAFAAVVAALDEEIAARREQFAGWLERLMTFDAREVAVA